MKTCAVIVAAGRSSRMGAFKPLLPVGSKGEPALLYLINTLHSVGIDLIFVVTGAKANLLEKACENMSSVTFVHNPDYATTEMFHSACLGLRALPKNCERILFTLVDIPLVKEKTVKKLLSRSGQLVYPSYKYRRGHPFVFNANLIPYILNHDGSGGLRRVFNQMNDIAEYVVVDDPFILMDIDTPEDYINLLKTYQNHT